jgi:hypothetical protein
MTKREAQERPTKSEGPQDADARRMQRELVDDLRLRAEKHGVEWGDLLRRADLSKSARSRLNSGVAGLETMGRLRRALDEIAPGGVDSSADTIGAVSARRQRRWVIVQRIDEKMFMGVTADSDDEIAAKRRVRLDRCRPLRAPEASASSLASTGPSSAGVAGPEAPSALLLDIAIVYDCTKAAVRAFETRK